MTREEKLQFIKLYKEPPYKISDPYYMREPWKEFGGVSSGICMCWCWYRDEIILSTVTDEELDKAYKEIKKFKFKKVTNRLIKCPSGIDVTEEECDICGQCRPRPN